VKQARLHFHSIRGKALDIIDTIIQTEEVVSTGKAFGVIYLVVEELVVNIVEFAYPDGGNDYLDVEIERDKESITLRFRDGGVPFNPLTKELPDTSLPIEQRRIGGLGIYLVFKKTDSVGYEYVNGENVLTVMKKLEN
jgi:anti-sigma regulatory factor (Ser/Thr protein kinase)